MEHADRVAKALEVSKGKFTELRGVSPASTPNIWAASVDFSTPVPATSFAEALYNYNLHNRLNQLPTTPTFINESVIQLNQIPTTPTIHPGITSSILPDVRGWSNHEAGEYTDNHHKWLQNWKKNRVAMAIPSSGSGSEPVIEF